MLFNSYIFILVFLPVCVFGYYCLNYLHHETIAKLFLILMSLWFYGYFNVKYVGVILSSVIINYAFFCWLTKSKWNKKVLISCGIVINVLILFYFKYVDFFLRTLNAVAKTEYNMLNIVLPLGISFFTFQQLSFIIDAYRGEIKECDFLSYVSFVTFFPQLIAGPIVTHDELIPQLNDSKRKKIDWNNFAKGIYIFVLGLAKKVLIADTFSEIVTWGFSSIEILDTTNAVIVMISYTIQIYFDFSGYCDMAIGLGKMLNIDLPLNFNSPYKSITITEFWDRWHITLTRFLTKYIYIPLGGNRKGKFRTYLNTMLVYLISGFWHGANWTFVLWGMGHGLFTVTTKHFKKFISRLHPALNWLITFGFVNVMWVFFRADSVSDAIKILKQIALLDFGPIHSEIINCFNLPEIEFLFNLRFVPDFRQLCPNVLPGIGILLVICILLGTKNSYERMNELNVESVRGKIKIVTLPILLIWCIFSFVGVSTFLYFNF